ncbi:MAG: HmuY family protein [Dehalococcoidia bacterium]
MATNATGTRSLLKPVGIGLAALLVALIVLAGAWLLWVFVLRSPPAGFAPTAGEASDIGSQQTTVLQFTIDARSRENWVYFSFEEGVTLSTSQDALDWDLAFRRNDLLTNGGESNPLGMGGAVDLGEVPLAEAVAPSDGFLTDATDEERGLENPELHKWYGYSWTTHIITSKNHTYAVRTPSGDVALLTFASYYCDDGSSGCVTFQYRRPEES